MPISLLNTIALSKKHLFAIAVAALLFYYFGYVLERESFFCLIGTYSILFALFIYLYKQQLSFKQYTIIGVVFRGIFLLSIPLLSQDFYRFIWDGRMLLNGFNPYLYLPENYLLGTFKAPNEAAALYEGMGQLNGSHYSNYPPLNQLCFAFAALISSKSILGSVIVFRLIIILADLGVLFFGKKLLNHFRLNTNTIFLYFLNPFIIIELTGNLHFEGVMICLLIMGLYYLKNQKMVLSAFFIAASIALKLLPLLFLPLFFQLFQLKKLIVFYLLIIGITMLFFLPFIDSAFLANYTRTISLWFGQFEFNGSLHHLAKKVAVQISGYNSIKEYIKIITPILVIVFTLIMTFFRKNKNIKQLIVAMLFTLFFYLATSTTVHPWYLAMLLIFSVFTTYRFPLVWSFVIMFTYLTYANPNFIENPWMLLLEYSIVYGFLIWELFYKKQYKKTAYL